MFNKFRLGLFWASISLLVGCAPKPVQVGEKRVPGLTEAQVTINQPKESKTITAVRNAGNGYATDQPLIAQGEALFQSNCTACHNFKQKGIGPNLAGVTAEWAPDQLAKFIRNAPEVIKSGHARAKRLFEEYNQYMPPFPGLSDAQVQALMAYINSNRGETAAAANTENLGEVLKDPIPTKIPKSGLQLSLEEVTTAPATADKVPLARINKMVVLPGKKDRQFIEDLRGILYEMQNNQLRVFMDMTKERPKFIPAPGLATGFGSYAFHPEFNQNGLFYTTHTEPPNTAPADFAYPDSIKVTLQWVLTEWKMTDPNAPVFSGTGREMLRVNMVTPTHGVQEITFNPFAKPGSPDYGLLYMGIGDGGSAEQGYYFICNSTAGIYSSVLRLDPKGRNSKNGKYGIPVSNPFAQDNDPASLGEVFARGFRNPNRITWTADGKMLISDIGLANAEELNIGQAGADYGWPAREGTFLINYRGKMDRVYPLPADDAKFKYTYPVAQFDHDEGNAFSAGFVYTGTNIPLLKDKYIFGDIVSGRVFFVENSQLKLGQQAPIQELDILFAGKPGTFQEITGSKKTDLRFGVGLNHEFYIYTKADGKIWKVKDCSRQKKA